MDVQTEYASSRQQVVVSIIHGCTDRICKLTSTSSGQYHTFQHHLPSFLGNI